MKIEKQEMLIDMFTLRIQGKTFEEIGQKYGMTRQGAWDHLKRTINEGCLIPKHAPKRRKLAEWIAENGKNINELAEMVGVSRNTISSFLKGSNISSKTLGKILNVTGLSFEDLEGEE